MEEQKEHSHISQNDKNLAQTIWGICIFAFFIVIVPVVLTTLAIFAYHFTRNPLIFYSLPAVVASIEIRVSSTFNSITRRLFWDDRDYRLEEIKIRSAKGQINRSKFTKDL